MRRSDVDITFFGRQVLPGDIRTGNEGAARCYTIPRDEEVRGATSLLCDDGNTTSGGQVQPSPVLKSEKIKESF